PVCGRVAPGRVPARLRHEAQDRAARELQGQEVRRRAAEGDRPDARREGSGGEEVSEVAGLMLCDDLIFFSRVSGTARAAGLTVRMVRSAADLLAAAKAAPPGGVIVDVHNPGLDLPALLADLK